MTLTAIGPVCDELGQASRRTHTQNRHGVWTTSRKHWAMPATGFRHRQAATINVDASHDHIARGKVVHLELSATYPKKLWAVAELDHDQVAELPGPLYWSAEADWNADDSSTSSSAG